MRYLTFTLIGDGPSDRALMPIIEWVLAHSLDTPQLGNFVSYGELRSNALEQKVRRAIGLYPCDLLFVHRDAERVELETRVQEIDQACAMDQIYVPVVPVRMTEAWLLFDDQAIRRAADNPNGRVDLDLPPLRTIERLPDPKQTLFEILRRATELSRRRLRGFNENRARTRISELIADFSPLRQLHSFEKFEGDVSLALRELEARR